MGKIDKFLLYKREREREREREFEFTLQIGMREPSKVGFTVLSLMGLK